MHTTNVVSGQVCFHLAAGRNSVRQQIVNARGQQFQHCPFPTPSSDNTWVCGATFIKVPMESLLATCAANALIANVLTPYSTMAESLNANIELFPSSSNPYSNYFHHLWWAAAFSSSPHSLGCTAE